MTRRVVFVRPGFAGRMRYQAMSTAQRRARERDRMRSKRADAAYTARERKSNRERARAARRRITRAEPSRARCFNVR
jgi:hypothetical protein